MRIKDSIGELDSLAAARDSLNTEQTTVVYADLEEPGFANLSSPGLAFCNDLYAGVLNIKTELLLSIMSASEPTATILEMASLHKIEISTIKQP